MNNSLEILEMGKFVLNPGFDECLVASFHASKEQEHSILY
jgi:hypothetical protein